MMKKLIALMLVLMAATVPVLAEPVDTFTSASVADFYGEAALTGEDLMNAINSFSGFYLVSTCNPDGSVNAAFFIFGCKALGEDYYLQMGLAENQTLSNLRSDGKGVAVYAANPTGEDAKPYAMSGARMTFEVVTDEGVLASLRKDDDDASVYAKILGVRSLG